MWLSSLGREDGDNIEDTEDVYNNSLSSDILEATSGIPLSLMEMTVNDVASYNVIPAVVLLEPCIR